MKSANKSLTPSLTVNSNSDGSGKEFRMPLWLTVTIILLGLAFMSWQLILFSGASDYSDSFTYYEAWEDLKTLHPNQWRPPVYALLIGILKEIFGYGLSLAVLLVLQWGIYLYTLQAIWEINIMLGINRGLNSAAVLVFLLIPGFWVMNNFAMAECLAGCGIVWFIWACGRWHINHQVCYLYLSAFLMAGLIFTKPVMILLIPIFACYWLYVYHSNRSVIRNILLLVAAAVSLTVVYGFSIKRFHGVFALTRASADNQYYCLREDGIIIPEEIRDPQLRERFRPFYETDPGRHAPGMNLYKNELWQFGWKEKKQMAGEAIRLHPETAFRGTIIRFKDAASFSQFLAYEPYELPYATETTFNYPGYIGHIYPYPDIFSFPILVGWIISLCFSAIWIYRWIRNKRFPSLPFLIASTFIVGMTVSIAGAQDSWGRLVTPFNPLLPVMAANILSILYAKISSLRHRPSTVKKTLS